MSTAVNRAAAASIHVAGEIADDLALLASELRSITVQVRSGGTGAGAGVIWSPEGLVVTNAHVIGSRWNQVALPDGRELDAELLRRDPSVDLAALRLPFTNHLSARLRDPQSLRVGEMVFAVGNPFGETGAISMGVVHMRSARLLVADIRLAPGNSGGPLADTSGRIVGINCMVVNGLGMAVPSDVVQRFLAGLRGRAAAEAT